METEIGPNFSQVKNNFPLIVSLGESAFAKTAGVKTITPNKKGVVIGQRMRLRPIDIEKANMYYNCYDMK